jgi:hypothetical protein
VTYVHEPFNVDFPNRAVGLRLERWFTWAPGSAQRPEIFRAIGELLDRNPWRMAIRHSRRAGGGMRTPLRFLKAFVLAAARRDRILIKDPLALLSAEWLHATFGLSVVCLIRRPLAFAGSIKKAGWPFDFGHLLAQEELMTTRLSSFRDEMNRVCDEDADLVDQAILLWNVLHSVILGYRERYPSWVFVRHEDLVADPVGGFEEVYARLDLRMDPSIRRAIRQQTSADNPAETDTTKYRPRDARASLDTWQTRLTAEEIDRVRRRTSDLASAFYGDDV